MSPPYIADKPGKSPMGMDLVPVYADEVAGGTSVAIDPVIVQNMGVRVATVATGPLRTHRARDRLSSTRRSRTSTTSTCASRAGSSSLYADIDGMHVDAGAPALRPLQPRAAGRRSSELIARAGAARDAARRAARRCATRRRAEARAARPAARRDRAPRRASSARRRRSPSRSPITGHVIEKPVVAGAAVKAGDARAAHRRPLDAVARRAGLRAGPAAVARRPAAPRHASPPARPARSTARSIFVHPHLDPTTRTATARMARAPTPALALRPGMYATVEIDAELAAARAARAARGGDRHRHAADRLRRARRRPLRAAPRHARRRPATTARVQILRGPRARRAGRRPAASSCSTPRASMREALQRFRDGTRGHAHRAPARRRPRGRPMIAAHHRALGPQPAPRAAADRDPRRARRLGRLQHPPRRDSRPVRRAGDRRHRLPRARTRRWSTTRSPTRSTSAMLAVPGSTVRARLQHVRAVVRLRAVRRRHRHLLGAQPRARVPELRPRPPARGRRAEARPGRDRRRLGATSTCSIPAGTAPDHPQGLWHDADERALVRDARRRARRSAATRS